MNAQLMPYNFRGDLLDVVWLPDRSDVGVSLRRLCEAIPVAFAPQTMRLAREAKKGATWACVIKMITHDESGRRQEMLILPRRSIPFFAATISLGSVREKLRAGITAKLAGYQDECAEALADHFLGPRQPLALAGTMDVRALGRALRDELDAREARLREAWREDFLRLRDMVADEVRVTVRAAVSPWAQMVVGLTTRLQIFEHGAGAVTEEQPAQKPRRGKAVPHKALVNALLERAVQHSAKTRVGLQKAREDGVAIGRPSKSPDLAKARELHADGLSIRRIAERLGVPFGTLQRHFRKAHPRVVPINAPAVRAPKKERRSDREPPTRRADLLYDALTAQAFPQLRVRRAIKLLGAAVETLPMDELMQQAHALLARRPRPSEDSD